MLHVLSSSRSVSFQPQNFTYLVKQTDIILSPNQSIYVHDVAEIDECSEGDDTFPFDKELIEKPFPRYPYEDDDDDNDLEFDIIYTEPIDHQSDTSHDFESLSDPNFYRDFDGFFVPLHEPRPIFVSKDLG